MDSSKIGKHRLREFIWLLFITEMAAQKLFLFFLWLELRVVFEIPNMSSLEDLPLLLLKYFDDLYLCQQILALELDAFKFSCIYSWSSGKKVRRLAHVN